MLSTTRSVFSSALAIGVLSMGLLATTAQATLLSDRTTFENMMATVITDDYSNSGYEFSMADEAFSAVLNETQYTSVNGSFIGNFNPSDNLSDASEQYYCAGCNGSFSLDFTSTSIGNDKGVYGVAFDYFYGPVTTNTPLVELFAFVTFGDGSSENFALSPVDLDAENWNFFGVVSDQLISSLHVGLQNGQPTEDADVGIDNLAIGAMAVAEPSSVAGGVLVALSLLRLNRSRGQRKQYVAE